MVKVLTHLIAPLSSKPLLYHKWLRFLVCSLCSLALAIPKHNIPQTDETTKSLGLIRGSKGGHLHLFTSPKDAEDDFEVWNPEEFPPDTGIKRQTESPRILTSNEATISNVFHIAISYSSAVLLQGSTTSCWQYLERPKSCIWQSGCFLSLYHVSWKDPGNIVAGWYPMLKMEIINSNYSFLKDIANCKVRKGSVSLCGGVPTDNSAT